jgi:TonB family protein
LTVRIRSLAALVIVGAVLAGCSRDDEAHSEAPKPAADASGPAPAASADAKDTRELLAAVQDYASSGCEAAKRRLDACKPCETSEQRPLRDLLYAYCAERETPNVARNLYEAIVLAYPGTETSATAMMRLRQLERRAEAAEAAPPASGAKPTPRERGNPAYPRLAAAAGVEGHVRLRFEVDAQGHTANVRVVESEPPLLFDAAALYAVESWRYEPGAAGAQDVRLRFDLEEEPAALAAGSESDATMGAPAAAIAPEVAE